MNTEQSNLMFLFRSFQATKLELDFNGFRTRIARVGEHDHHRSWRPINLGSLHELSIQYVCWKLTIALRKIYSPLPFVEIVILTNMSDCHPLQVDLQYLNWLLEPMSQNKFENSYAMLHWNNPLWLVKTSHMTCSSQSECFIFT